MTPTLSITFSAAADGREVKIDELCSLISVHVGAATATTLAVLSKDRNSTVANSVTATGNSADENIIAIPSANRFVQLAFPLFAGQSVFVSCSGAGAVVLAFQLDRLP